MGRPAKSLTSQIISGQIKKNPSRYLDRALDPPPQCAAGIGDPPRHLPKSCKNIWHEIVSEAAPGQLQSGDRKVLELACVLVDKFRNPSTRKKTITKPNGDVTVEEWFEYMQTSEMALMMNTLAKLGMSPIDRAKVKTPESPKEPVEVDPLLAMSQIN